MTADEKNITRYVEQDCSIEHEGRMFTAGGAVVTEQWLIAYPAANGVLTTGTVNRWEHGALCLRGVCVRISGATCIRLNAARMAFGTWDADSATE
jgi:hypothetical protein